MALESVPETRRAYVVLSFIASGLLFGSIALRLGIPPYATYAGQNLWNYRLLSPTESVTDPSNLVAQLTFTDTPDESWFFIILAAIEARGAPIIMHALHAFEAVCRDDAVAVENHLTEIVAHLRDLIPVLPRMYEQCNPDLFYNCIRPFLSGCKASCELPRGIFYENEHGGGTWQQFSGPTAAQSSLWQFIDLALGVKHRSTGTVVYEDDDVVGHPGVSSEEECLFLRMRDYMPGPHRRFLQRVAQEANIRAYVRAHPNNEDLLAAYNNCLDCLIEVRSKHLQIISRYIVVPSRRAEQKSLPTVNPVVGPTGTEPNKRMEGQATAAVAGTGGTSPMAFLKQVRDETQRTLIHVEK
ncbi:MAG: hypothetical protein LQ337_006162 [Flavoplaca oasis]|nr:MAG: hypothetical protein LQ337_006162 [Flavoplaca oasis]